MPKNLEKLTGVKSSYSALGDLANSNKHRNDIDGLRALAVVPVIFYHIGIETFSGGYVGVDVFLVISGYLITSILLKEVAEGSIDFIKFYERRVRRLLPALFLVILASSVAAWFILLPIELKNFGQSVLASTLFSSNILFWLESGYFDAASETKPLLHTWSLAVEEQFYLVYPLILITLSKLFKTRLVAALLGLLALSFATSLYLTEYYPSASFYMLVGRMWELLLGALIAVGFRISMPLRWHREVASFLGLSLIIYSVFGFDQNTKFPGLGAVAPCIGTTLLINSGIYGTCLVRQALENKLLVGLGLLSYSLYLWHWPVIVFSQFFLQREFTVPELALVLSVVLAASYISWRFVEKPFRNRSGFASRRLVFGASVSLMVCLVSFGWILHIGNGMSGRLPVSALKISDIIMESDNIPNECFFYPRQDMRVDSDVCRIDSGNSGEDRAFLLWGDSHAHALYPGIASVAGTNNLTGYFVGHADCPPLQGVSKSTGINDGYVRNSSCEILNDRVLNFVGDNTEIDRVILFARWVINVEGIRLDTDPMGNRLVYISDVLSDDRDIAANMTTFERGLKRTLNALKSHNKKVLIIGPLPEFPIEIAPAMARASLIGIERDFRPLTATVFQRLSRTAETIERIAAEYDIDLILPHEIFCGTDTCQVAAGELPLFVDDNHVSVIGAEYLAKYVESWLLKE